jgi:3-polyprenyl-4-hydroxybenzoate decarboxylase
MQKIVVAVTGASGSIYAKTIINKTLNIESALQ